MPIKFRCQHCRQFLGISRDQAGAVTDCPTCGRTIRIPRLDGTIDPLPQPKLDLGDSDLASALDKLADIGQAQSMDSESASVVNPAVEEKSSPSVPERLHEPPKVSEVVLEPIVTNDSPQAPSSLPESVTAKTIEPPGLESPKISDLAPLQELAQQTAKYPISSHAQDSVKRRLLIGAVGFFLLFVGFLIGRWSAPEIVPQAATTPGELKNPPGQEEHAPAQPPDKETPLALTGRITYVSASGDTHPDAGARVLVLPALRKGIAKLPMEGFRAGADSQDAKLATILAASVGGHFAIADSDGRFQVQLPEAGEYRVLIISRYQPREETGPLAPQVKQFLGQYFERPEQLLGQTEYHMSPFRYRGEGSVPRDHTFTR